MKTLHILCVASCLLLGCTEDTGETEPQDNNTSNTTQAPDVDTNPCFTEQTFTMTQTADDGLAVYYCPGEDRRGCGTFEATCDPQELLTFLREDEGLYGVRGRLLIVLDPDIGVTSGQSFPSVSEIPEGMRLTATIREDTPGPFGSYDGSLEVTFNGDTVTIHTLSDPNLPEP